MILFDFDKHDLKDNLIYYVLDSDSKSFFPCKYSEKEEKFITLLDKVNDEAKLYDAVKNNYPITSEFYLSTDNYKREVPIYKIKD